MFKINSRKKCLDTNLTVFRSFMNIYQNVKPGTDEYDRYIRSVVVILLNIREMDKKTYKIIETLYEKEITEIKKAYSTLKDN